MLNIPLDLIVDGQAVQADQVSEPLVRSAIISLFTWRRSDPGDKLPGIERYGWWGDTFPTVPNDKIGSRLWLLSRSALTDEAVVRAKSYASEALAWMIEDGVATAFEVQAERQGLDKLALGVLIVRGDKSTLNIRFSNVWDYLQ